MRRLLILALLLLAPGPLMASDASDAAVALMNVTGATVTCTITHPTGEPIAVELPPGVVRAVAVGQVPTIAFTVGIKTVRYRIDPYAVYAFAPGEGSGVTFQGVNLVGNLPPTRDVPALPSKAVPIQIPVVIACDSAEVRSRPSWEARTRAVITQANRVLAPQLGITLDVVAVKTWSPGPSAATLEGALADLTKGVEPGRARLVIGFTPRTLGYEAGHDKVPQFYAAGPLLGDHLLLRENLPKTEMERAEVLLQAAGRWLGAGEAPDPNTIMRSKLGDGRANLTKFHVQYDPFNLMILRVMSGELKHGTRSLRKVDPVSQERLRCYYKSLLEAVPADPAAIDHLATLTSIDPDEVAKAEPEMPRGEKEKPAPEPDARHQAIRAVVTAVRLRAEAIAALPPGERPRDDALTADLAQTAADIASTVGGPHAASAFVVGLGIGLDDTTLLRDNIVTRELVTAVETDDEFQARVAALGVPTLGGRRDLCQHFAVSCALTDVIGARPVELIGLTKEVKDLRGETGFDFADMHANYAGISLAGRVRQNPKLLDRFRAKFPVEDVLPPTDGLPEPLFSERFERDYGSLTDPRMQKVLDAMKKKIAEAHDKLR